MDDPDLEIHAGSNNQIWTMQPYKKCCMHTTMFNSPYITYLETFDPATSSNLDLIEPRDFRTNNQFQPGPDWSLTCQVLYHSINSILNLMLSKIRDAKNDDLSSGSCTTMLRVRMHACMPGSKLLLFELIYPLTLFKYQRSELRVMHNHVAHEDENACMHA